VERRGLALFFVGLALISPSAQAQSNPSIDCQKATTAVETLVCSDPTLAELDRKIAEAFREWLEQAPAGDRATIREAQLDWLKARGVGCGLDPRQPGFRRLGASPPAGCLREVYEESLKNPIGQITSRYAPLQRMELPFEATVQPFLPYLLVSRDPALCDAFAAALRQDFLARHPPGEPLFWQPRMALGHWIAWPSEYRPTTTSAVDIAEVDLDQTGDRQLLIQIAQPFGWHGNDYALLLRSNAKTDGLEDEIRQASRELREGRSTSSTSFKAIRPGTTGWGMSRWGMAKDFTSPWKLLSYEGALYLLDVSDALSGGDQAGTANLRRLHADGSTEISCQAGIAPMAKTLPLPSWQRAAPRDEVAVPAKLTEWLQTIREIQGNEGQMPGSLHALSYLIMRSSYVWYDAVVRPWEVAHTRPPRALSADFMRSWIRNWGYGSLSRFRLARAFEAGREDALEALADYYARSFGVARSRETASVALDNMLSVSFVVHRPREDAAPVRQEIHDFAEGRAQQASRLLRAALLLGTSPGALDEFIKAGATLGGAGTPEPALFYALEQPDEVAWLLGLGADINEGNAFGKTALMYAAHYNLDNTVTLLLERGADVTRRTDGSKAIETAIRHDGRTALMYAAENASARVIRELITAGSDVCAIDTGKRDVANYLSRNQRLSEGERAAIVELIAQTTCG